MPALSALTACVISILGASETGLFAQPIWTPVGLRRLRYYFVAFAAIVIFQYVVCRRRAGLLILLLAVGYGSLLVGPLTFFALASLTVAAAGVGLRAFRVLGIMPAGQLLCPALAVLTGFAIYTALIGALAHFRLNYSIVYWLLVGGGCLLALLEAAGLRKQVALAAELLSVSNRSEFCARSLYLFTLGAQFVMALKPEIGADALSMHLAIAAHLRNHHVWHFDVTRLTWAVMPMGGDWAFAIAYLLGGEFASKLLPFVFMVFASLLVLATCRIWVSPSWAFLLTASFTSLPVIQLITGSMFVEAYWMAMLAGSVASLLLLTLTSDVRWFIIWSILLGAGMATKAITLAFVPACLAWVALEFYWWRRAPALRSTVIRSATALALFSLPPYAVAFAKTGNPLFPFSNSTFHAPYFEQRDFTLPQYSASLSFRTPFDITFHTSRYLESQNGAAGFWFLVAPLLLLGCLGQRWPRSVVWATIVAVVFFALTWYKVSYLRYVLPMVPILYGPISWSVSRMFIGIADRFRFVPAAIVTMGVFAQVYLMASSGYWHNDFALSPLDFKRESETYVRSAPARALNDYLNTHAPGEPAVFLINGIAGFKGRPYVASWHDSVFFDRLRKATTTAQIEEILTELRVRYILAPLPECAAPPLPLLRPYLSEYTSELFKTNCAYIAERRSPPVINAVR